MTSRAPSLISLCLACLLTPALFAGPALAQNVVDVAKRFVAVEGSGRATAPPDRAHVAAGVETRAETAADASRANAGQMAAIFEALTAAGVPARAIQTSNLSIAPVYDRPDRSGGAPALAGYQAVNQVTVEIDDVDRVGQVIDALAEAGANRIHGVRFAIADPTELRDQARREAVADARRKAALLADLAGVALGDLLRIEERGVSRPTLAMEAMDAARSVATPVAPGEQIVSASVSVRFAIADPPK